MEQQVSKKELIEQRLDSIYHQLELMETKILINLPKVELKISGMKADETQQF